MTDIKFKWPAPQPENWGEYHSLVTQLWPADYWSKKPDVEIRLNLIRFLRELTTNDVIHPERLRGRWKGANLEMSWLNQIELKQFTNGDEDTEITDEIRAKWSRNDALIALADLVHTLRDTHAHRNSKKTEIRALFADFCRTCYRRIDARADEAREVEGWKIKSTKAPVTATTENRRRCKQCSESGQHVRMSASLRLKYASIDDLCIYIFSELSASRSELVDAQKIGFYAGPAVVRKVAYLLSKTYNVDGELRRMYLNDNDINRTTALEKIGLTDQSQPIDGENLQKLTEMWGLNQDELYKITHTMGGIEIRGNATSLTMYIDVEENFVRILYDEFEKVLYKSPL